MHTSVRFTGITSFLKNLSEQFMLVSALLKY